MKREESLCKGRRNGCDGELWDRLQGGDKKKRSYTNINWRPGNPWLYKHKNRDKQFRPPPLTSTYSWYGSGHCQSTPVLIPSRLLSSSHNHHSCNTDHFTFQQVQYIQETIIARPRVRLSALQRIYKQFFHDEMTTTILIKSVEIHTRYIEKSPSLPSQTPYKYMQPRFSKIKKKIKTKCRTVSKTHPNTQFQISFLYSILQLLIKTFKQQDDTAMRTRWSISALAKT